MKFLLDYLFPRSEQAEKLYALSVSDLSALPPPSAPLETGVHALFDYTHPTVKEIVWEVKYKGSRELAEKVGVILYDVLLQELSENNFNQEYPVLLVPLPMSVERLLERSWNQAEILAKAVKRLDTEERFAYLPQTLVKVRHTESQTKETSRSGRLENLKDSMVVRNPAALVGQCAVLVDDVTTTGATFAEARRALKEAGAKKVICLAVAH